METSLHPKIRKLSQFHVFPYDCKYCEEMRKWDGKTHDDEMMDKAPGYCTSEYWVDFVFNELPYLDHGLLSTVGQIRALEKMHQETGCSCHIEDTVQDS